MVPERLWQVYSCKVFCDSDFEAIVKEGSSYIFSIESNFENVIGHHKVVYITLFKMPLV